MNVFAELIRIGVQVDVAQEIADAVARSTTVVTTEILDARLDHIEAHVDRRLAELEARLIRTTMTTMIALTGVYAVFVAAMGWVVR